MNLKKLNPRISLNKAFLKVKPLRSDIERFKRNLITLLLPQIDKLVYGLYGLTDDEIKIAEKEVAKVL